MAEQPITNTNPWLKPRDRTNSIAIPLDLKLLTIIELKPTHMCANYRTKGNLSALPPFGWSPFERPG